MLRCSSSHRHTLCTPLLRASGHRTLGQGSRNIIYLRCQELLSRHRLRRTTRPHHQTLLGFVGHQITSRTPLTTFELTGGPASPPSAAGEVADITSILCTMYCTCLRLITMYVYGLSWYFRTISFVAYQYRSTDAFYNVATSSIIECCNPMQPTAAMSAMHTAALQQ